MQPKGQRISCIQVRSLEQNTARQLEGVQIDRAASPQGRVDSAIGAIKEINYDVYPHVTKIFIGMSRFSDIRNGTSSEFSQSQCKNITH